MVNMSEESKKFLEKYLPDSLEKDEAEEIIMDLYDLIHEKGYTSPNCQKYNDFGKEAKGVSNDIYWNNDI